MKFLSPLPLAIIMALATCLGSSSSASAQSKPLSDLLEDWQGYSWSDIQDIANWEAKNDGPLYPSAPASTPHYETFEGSFTAESSATKIAIFSDDGCDVYINGTKVHSRRGHGQALPNLSQSLHQIGYSFVGGQTYQIKVDYSNTSYLGSADIDGASLFAYSDDPNQGVKVSFVSGLIGGVVRACAGGISNDGVHSTTIGVHAKQDGQDLINASLKFSFLNNVGNPKKAKFINEQGQEVDTLTCTTDSVGKVNVTVLSSDSISQPQIVAKYEEKEVGKVTCDFAPIISVRRFGLVNYPDEEDTGWIFNSDRFSPEVLTQQVNKVPAKIYLKFQIDPKVPIDKQYFNPDGTVRATLTDNGNWKFVNGHNLRITIKNVVRMDGEFVPENEFNKYATLVIGQNDQPVSSVDLTTAGDGATQVWLKAGPLVPQAAEIILGAQNQSQSEQ